MKLHKHIEIVRSTTVSLSSLSQESCDSIIKVLKKNYTRVGVSIVNSPADLNKLIALKPDVVFLGVKFVPIDANASLLDSEKLWIADFLDQHNVASTGSGHIAHELELNKDMAKACVTEAGLRTSPFMVIKQQHDFNEMPLKMPVFIKPRNRGGGLGIDSSSVATTLRQAQGKVRSITNNHGSDSLIEEYLPGREFSVAILKQKFGDGFLTMPIELIAPPDARGVQLLSEQVKSSNAERVQRVSDVLLHARVTSFALNVFKALGARDYGRIDIRLDAAGNPHFLEANLMPSLIAGYGSFPKACLLNQGLDYEPMILTIINLAMERGRIDSPEVMSPTKPATDFLLNKS